MGLYENKRLSSKYLARTKIFAFSTSLSQTRKELYYIQEVDIVGLRCDCNTTKLRTISTASSTAIVAPGNQKCFSFMLCNLNNYKFYDENWLVKGRLILLAIILYCTV